LSLSDDERQQAAREALDRVARESEIVGSSAIARAGRRVGNHFTAKDAREDGGGADPIELWGRRIGRGLSLLGVVVLTLWLAAQLGFF